MEGVGQNRRNKSCLKSVLDKFLVRDGLVWTVCLTVELKLRFQISPAMSGRYVKEDKD